MDFTYLKKIRKAASSVTTGQHMDTRVEANTLAGQNYRAFHEKLLYQGSALSHVGSMACFINDVIPGETGLCPDCRN